MPAKILKGYLRVLWKWTMEKKSLSNVCRAQKKSYPFYFILQGFFIIFLRLWETYQQRASGLIVEFLIPLVDLHCAFFIHKKTNPHPWLNFIPDFLSRHPWIMSLGHHDKCEVCHKKRHPSPHGYNSQVLLSLFSDPRAVKIAFSYFFLVLFPYIFREWNIPIWLTLKFTVILFI